MLRPKEGAPSLSSLCARAAVEPSPRSFACCSGLIAVNAACTQDLLIPTIHPPHEISMSPLLGNAPRKREILLFLRGDVGEHRCFCGIGICLNP